MANCAVVNAVLRPIFIDEHHADDRQRKYRHGKQDADDGLELFLPVLTGGGDADDVLLGLLHHALLRDILAGEKFIDADAEDAAQIRVQRHIRQAHAGIT